MGTGFSIIRPLEVVSKILNQCHFDPDLSGGILVFTLDRKIEIPCLTAGRLTVFGIK